MQTSERLIAALRSANLAALRFLGRPAQLADYLRTVNRLYLERTLAPVRPVDLRELVGPVPDPGDLFAPLDAIAPGSSSLADVGALAVLTRHKRPRRVFEIGTFEGLTASVFARNGGPGVEVCTLDLPQHGDEGIERTTRSFAANSIDVPYESGRLLTVYGCEDRVRLLRGDSAVFDIAAWAPVDLFFVDGAHTRDYVARDTLSAVQALAEDGWILWHDALVPDVLGVLRALAAVHPVYIVRETNLGVVTSRPPLAATRELLEPLAAIAGAPGTGAAS